MGNFKVVRVGHKRHAAAVAATANTSPNVLVPRAATTSIPASCSTGGFYTAPKIGDTIDAMQPLAVSWDPSCITTSKAIDIYLYAPGTSYPRIHVWTGVSLARKTYTLDLMPRWWNATATANLQLKIVSAGDATFLSTLPAGPIFTATYTAPAAGEPIPAAADTSKLDVGITVVNDAAQSSNHGKTAVAVLIPLLFLGLLAGAYFKWKRGKGLDKRKKWTEQVDKRMSTISGDWKSVSAAGAQAAIRNSMAVGNRASSFSFGGGIRPSGEYKRDESGEPTGDMSQRRPGVGLRNPSTLSGAERVSRVSFATDRVSRVSFANDPRPSLESRRTKAFRDSYVPPVPALPPASNRDDDEASSEGDGTLSPTQTQGAMTLTPEAIRARIAAGRARSGSRATTHTRDGTEPGMEGYDEVMPALTLMRSGGPNASTDDLLFAVPNPPAPTYPKLVNSARPSTPTIVSSSSPAQGMTSPVMASMPMQPASVMSPDDMLRAYAERKKSMTSTMTSGISVGSGGGGGMTAAISYPMPIANASTHATRVLFNGSTGVMSPQGTGEGGVKERTPSLGFAPGEYDANFVFAGHEAVGEGAYGAAEYEGGMEDAYGGYHGEQGYAVHQEEEVVGNFAGRGVYRG